VIGFVRSVGEMIVRLAREFADEVNFTGEVFTKLVRTASHPGSLRWRDTLLIAEKAGANAVGIAGLLGFLIGLIIAFQSAVALEAFGAEVFVADLVVLGLLRELGPLITAFVLASRSGSAFAAEIGTMKVNEEIDALTTMAVDPVQYLVLPRLIAAVCIMPLLTMFNELFGLIGCGVVMASWNVPAETYIERIRAAASLSDLFGGLVKTLVFGTLIAGLGCLRGLQTETGPSAVGDSATRAVVSGIVAIVVADGVFAVIYYFLGI
jgi:phospholipid/cholesterol/gamma-HCH transport system permease protein